MKLFQLTRNERLGLVGVILIFLVIICFKYFDAQVAIDYKPSSVEYTHEQLQSIDESKGKVHNEIVFFETKKVTHIAPFEKFNPNYVDSEYWKKIGFENKLAIRLEKFIRLGQGIRNIDDLEKVYGMKKEWIDLIKDHIVLEQLRIDINTGSAESFQKVSGIGEKISNRIIKFRNSLGGFYNIEQLDNVYGIDSTIIKKNLHLFVLNTPQNKINVNQSGLNKMAGHPLINTQQGEEIIKIRSVYGKIDSLALRNIFTSKEWREVKHYLKWKN